jgi:isopenicillin-N N-acyltransferase-like protein
MEREQARAIPDLPFIEVSGSPEARGRLYGEAARERIATGVGHYSEQLAKTRLSAAELTELVRGFLPRIDAFDPTYVPEMRGIADGANRPLADIVLLNCRTEILKLGPKRARAEGRDTEDLDCTGLVCQPSVTADGRLIHAQNWDWKVECAETSVILKIRREDGALARSGFNAAGVAITANYLECERDYARIGVPLALIRRKVLQTGNLALAMHAVYATPKSASNNMIVSHPAGTVIDFECAPDETFQVHPDNGVLAHANHWVSPVALTKLTDTGIKSTPDTLFRDLRVRDLVAPHRGRITRDTVKQALFDDFQSPWSVCRPPRLNLSGTKVATVAMIVMVPEQGLMEVAILPALDKTFTTYRLDMDPEAFQGVPTARHPVTLTRRSA